MKKILIVLTALFFTAMGFQSCEDLDDNEVPVNGFIWKGLNLYYLWKDEVPNLRDDRFANQAQLNEFLVGYSSPEDLFYSLLYDYPDTDRFSVIFPDYTVLENALQGVVKSNGVEYGLKYVEGSNIDIFGYVRYILPGSDAASKDIQRGDLFYAVNGTPLTLDNYRSLLAGDTYTLNLATYAAGVLTPTNESVSLTKTEYAENPVYFVDTYAIDGHNIGYFMYNGFFSNYDTQLNAAFGQLAAQNVTDLVLDLRYNSGGSINTATYLASMVTGQFTGQVFAKEQWNSRLQSFYESNNPSQLVDLFASQLTNGTPINSLNLNKVYILTTQSTASASELVINGLKPYIDVVVIGETTTGKNVGSVTLYDSRNFTRNDRNPSHRYAMQPIVLKTVNRDGFGDYSDGIAPDITRPENMANLGQIGDVNEPLFATAIAQITGNGRFSQPDITPLRSFADSKSMRRFGTELYKNNTPEGSDALQPLPEY